MQEKCTLRAFFSLEDAAKPLQFSVLEARIAKYDSGIRNKEKCWKIWKYEKIFVPLQHIGAKNKKPRIKID